MASHHVTCHVTVMSRASSSSLKRKKKKEKEIQKKRNIKSRKIDKRKRKMLVSKAFHNIQDMSDSNTTSNPCSYLALSESKSAVIFICFYCLIIFFKLYKFTQTLHRVFPSLNLSSYLVFHY